MARNQAIRILGHLTNTGTGCSHEFLPECRGSEAPVCARAPTDDHQVQVPEATAELDRKVLIFTMSMSIRSYRAAVLGKCCIDGYHDTAICSNYGYAES